MHGQSSKNICKGLPCLWTYVEVQLLFLHWQIFNIDTMFSFETSLFTTKHGTKSHNTSHTAAKTSNLKKEVAQPTELGPKSDHRLI